MARAINRHKTSIRQYEKRPTLQAQILWDLSHGLKHNFFQDLADLLPNEYTTSAIKDTSKDEEIKHLEGELNLAKAQITVLCNIVMGQKELPKKE